MSEPLPADALGQAWQLLRLHRPALALELARQLLAADPTNLAAQVVNTEALRQLGCLPEAEAAAAALIAQAPGLAQGFELLAQVYGQQGRLPEAGQAIGEALRLDPLEPASYGFLAQLHYLQAQPELARAAASTGLSIYPRHPECLLWRALAHEHLRSREAADADFAHLLHLAPTHALAHLHRGRVLLWRGEAPAAAGHLATALQLAPGRSAALVPLLRRARREEHWPRWVRHYQGQARHARGLTPLAWLRGGTAAFVLPAYRLRSWWRTRRDPLFQHPAPAQRVFRRGRLLQAGLGWLLTVAGVGYCCLLLGLPPWLASLPAFLVFRGLLHRAARR